jgi:uncharacterized protein (DUF58 family)
MEPYEERLSSLFAVPLILFFVGCFLFVGLLNGQKDLTVWAMLVLFVVGGAKVWGRLSLSGVKCSLEVDKKKVFPDETFTLKIAAENAKILPVWLRLKVAAHSAVRPATNERGITRESGLLWHQRVRFLWELTAQQRGVHPIGPLRVMVGDLLGFFPRERVEEVLSILVYPRIVPLKPFSLPKRDLFGVPGTKSPVQDPAYVLGTREYQPWQPARYIHWKASARHNRLQEKVFDPSEQTKALLVIDVEGFSINGAEDAFEQAIEVAASIALALDRKGYAIGFATNGVLSGGGASILPIAKNPQQLPAVLEAMARLGIEPQGDLNSTLSQGLSLPWGVSCVHFTYETDDRALAADGYFARRRIPTLFLVNRVRSECDGQRFRGRVHRFEDVCLKDEGRK